MFSQDAPTNIPQVPVTRLQIRNMPVFLPWNVDIRVGAVCPALLWGGMFEYWGSTPGDVWEMQSQSM